MLHNRVIRTVVSVFLFMRILLSYVWFSLITRPLTPKAKRREKLEKVHAKNAAWLYFSFALLKGVYIKIGQFLSTQMALLPAVYLVEMTKMQDRLPRASTEAIRKRIVEAYGKSAEEMFARFDPEPLACASIGQVHRVKLKDGREAVIKCKYPGIDKFFQTDLYVIRGLMPLFVRIIELAYYHERSGIDHNATIGEFAKYIGLELDYRNECRNQQHMYDLLAEMRAKGQVIVPELYHELCTESIICMQYIEATKMVDWYANPRVPAPKKDWVYRCLLEASLYTIAHHGFFQADTHPGNFLVHDKNPESPDSKATLVMIDFGCSKQLPERFRIGIVDVINGYLTKQNDLVTNALWDLGYRTKLYTKDSLGVWVKYGTRVTDEILKHFRDGTHLIDHLKANLKEMTAEYIEIDQAHRADYIPEEYVMLGRALATPPIPIDKYQPRADIIAIVMPFMSVLAVKAQEDKKRLAATGESMVTLVPRDRARVSA